MALFFYSYKYQNVVKPDVHVIRASVSKDKVTKITEKNYCGIDSNSIIH